MSDEAAARRPQAAAGPPPRPPGPSGSEVLGDLTDELRTTSTWTDDMVARAGIPMIDVPLVTVGGGFGSFVLADHLRVAGMPIGDLRALTPLSAPYEQYRYLAGCSQIPDDSRLRSDSASCPDNLWGFPSYALREAWEARSPLPIFGVASEPVLADYFTPRAEQVYRTTAKEAARIGWDQMVVPGRVRMMRKRRAAATSSCSTPPTRHHPHQPGGVPGALGARLGRLPGCEVPPRPAGLPAAHRRLPPGGQCLRAARPRLRRARGRWWHGVAARLGDRRVPHPAASARRRGKRGARTRIIHLFRTYRTGSSGPATFRRESANGFNYQAFNYPKAAWGGTLREKLMGLDGQQRVELIQGMGGTNTPHRKQWDQQLDRARAAGIYRPAVGVVDSVESRTGQVLTTVKTPDGQLMPLPADYVIDATGLESDVSSSQLLDDLSKHTGASRNPLNRLDVSGAFELTGTRSGDGRMYASGSITLGGPYAPVDSFLGLQYVAMQILDDLAAQGFVQRLGSWRSVTQWMRWARGVAP